MDVATQLRTLSQRISEHARMLSDYAADLETQSSGQSSQPSLEEWLPTDAPEGVRGSQKSLLEATWELQTLCQGPSELMEHHQISYQQLSALAWLSSYDIFSHVPLTAEGASWTDVASAAGCSVSRLQSVARMAMTNGLLREVPVSLSSSDTASPSSTSTTPSRLAHSRLSASFARQPSYGSWAVFAAEYSAVQALKFAEASKRYPVDTVAKNETAFNVMMGTERPFFDFVGQDARFTARFAGYMRALAATEGLALRHVLAGFDWAALGGGARLVDVGGSTGHVSGFLLGHFPGLVATVQDRAETVAGVLERGAGAGADGDDDGDGGGIGALRAAGRLEFVAHDFFTPQPAGTGDSVDVFLLRNILHDWPDAEVVQILTHLAAALTKPGACILVADQLLPIPGSQPALREALLRVRDLTMAQTFNARERELVDWERLFAQVTPRLRLKNCELPRGSAMAFMQLVREDQ